VLLRQLAGDRTDARPDGRRRQQGRGEEPEHEPGGAADPCAGSDLTRAVLVDGDSAVIVPMHHDRRHDLEIRRRLGRLERLVVLGGCVGVVVGGHIQRQVVHTHELVPLAEGSRTAPGAV
jgi:hypothetical protein